MGINITVRGLDGLRNEVERAGGDIRVAIRRAVADSTDAIGDDARRHVPVDTGRLRDSISTTVGKGGLSGAVGVFDPKAFYGQFVEHGTSNRPPRPFMIPAAERERRRFPDRVIDEVRRHLR